MRKKTETVVMDVYTRFILPKGSIVFDPETGKYVEIQTELYVSSMGPAYVKPSDGTIQVKFFSYPKNCGDGSASVYLFSTREKADHYEELESETNDGSGWGEHCVGQRELTVDPFTGNVVGGSYVDRKHYSEDK